MLWILPAHEGLEPEEASRGQVDGRLEVQDRIAVEKDLVIGGHAGSPRVRRGRRVRIGHTRAIAAIAPGRGRDDPEVVASIALTRSFDRQINQPP